MIFRDYENILSGYEAEVARTTAELMAACRDGVSNYCPYVVGERVPVKGNWSYAGREISVETIDLQRSNRLHGGSWVWILTGRLVSKTSDELLTIATVSFIKAGDEDVTDGKESGESAAAGV